MSSRTSATNELRRRLGRRLDQQLAALRARDPGFQEHVRREARRRALQSLGLAELQAEWDALATQRQELARRRRRLRRALGAAVQRVPPAAAANQAADRPEDEVRRALRQRQVLHEREVLAEDERGQEILRLEREKEHLGEAVWLATAPPPLQRLWQQGLALLGAEATALEQAALVVATEQAGLQRSNEAEQRRYDVRASVVDEAGGSDGAYDLIADRVTAEEIAQRLTAVLSGTWGLTHQQGKCRLDLHIGEAGMGDDLPL